MNLAEEADAWYQEYSWVLPDEETRRMARQLVIRAYAAGHYAAEKAQERGEISCTGVHMERARTWDYDKQQPPFGFRSATP